MIVGGGTGGCAAAMACLSLGLRVVISEPTRWVGGQLTSQLVPPDEHRWIESTGCTRRFREFRDRVRAAYLGDSRYLRRSENIPDLNPGGGWVSRLCFEPKIGLSVLDTMLIEASKSGSLTTLLQTELVSAEVDGDVLRSVSLRDNQSGDLVSVSAKYFLDASEVGDLVLRAGVEHRIGAEAQSEFGELHAPEVADERCVQALTWCIAVERVANGEGRCERPSSYAQWRDAVPLLTPRWPGRLLDWTVSDARSLAPRKFALFGGGGLFSYRQVVCGSDWNPVRADVSLINWPQNDLMESVLTRDEANNAAVYERAKELSRSLLYWLQTEAPREDGGAGYPELQPASVVADTADGLALAAYHRESRRIWAVVTVSEADVGAEQRSSFGSAKQFSDSVGVGAYRIDLHPTASGRNFVDVASYPFQIPLGTLIPVRVRNLVAAGKCLGVTHIANGCYRLHPVEWNVGESAGLVAGYCLAHGKDLHEVAASRELPPEFEVLLDGQGIQREWAPDIRGFAQ